MEASYCDVIGCTTAAGRFYSDGFAPVERLCDRHWKELLFIARDRALRFEKINPSRLESEPDEVESFKSRPSL